MGRRGPLSPSDYPPLGPRVVVGGVSGSGKTTLAAELARRVGGPHIQLDALFHKEGWQESTDEEFFAKIQAAIAAAGDRWVVDGNYTRSRHLTWANATTLVFLDYPFGLATWRTVKRTTRRLLSREPLWNGNRERLGNLFDKGHPIWWSMHHYGANRRSYEDGLADPRWAHLDVIHIRKPSQLRAWLRYAARP